jgi:transposase
MFDFGDPPDEALTTVRGSESATVPLGPLRFKSIRRDILEFRVFDLDGLIEAEHAARAIWEFLEQVDLSAFEAGCKAHEGRAGQSPIQPRLLVALWLMACVDGVGSARELARRCEHHPAYRWLCGDAPINHHTLSDFRVDHAEAVQRLFVEVLAVLSYEGLVTLRRVAHDGTKIGAVASPASYHREKTIEICLAEAQTQVEALGDPRQDQDGVQAAQRRAATERKQRLEQARAQLQQLQAKETKSEKREQVRVSISEPDARIMKQPGSGFAPGYNAQLTTDEAHGIVVNVAVSSNGSDFPQLVPALEQVKENFGKLPDQVLADGGYMSRENIETLDGRTDLIGPCLGTQYVEAQRQRNGIDARFASDVFVYDPVSNRFHCPRGETLKHVCARPGVGKIEHTYSATVAQCSGCPDKALCCPKSKFRRVLRIQESPAVERFRSKVAEPASKAIYKLRARVAEFSNCWIKEKFKLRRFHVRGLIKVQSEMLWHVIAYNLQRWTRLRWKDRLATP